MISSTSAAGSIPLELQRVADDVHEAIGGELHRRHVDRHRHPREGVAPQGALTAGLVQHPAAHLVDDADLLGQGDESIRRDPAERRVVPAQQCLDAGEPEVREVDHGLVVELELLLARARRGGRWPFRGARARLTASPGGTGRRSSCLGPWPGRAQRRRSAAARRPRTPRPWRCRWRP